MLYVNIFVLLISLAVYKIVKFWLLLNLTLSDFLRNKTRKKKSVFRIFAFLKSFFFNLRHLNRPFIIKYIWLLLRYRIQSINMSLFLILFTRDVINAVNDHGWATELSCTIKLNMWKWRIVIDISSVTSSSYWMQ